MAVYPKNAANVAAANEETGRGALAALFAFTIWGLLPMYWKLFTQVNALEIICHRGVWTLLCMVPLVLYTKRLPEVLAALHGRNVLLLCASSALLALNWLVFVWAVANDHILETSLGNFMTPLLTMLFGVIFFKDAVTRLQWISILLVVAAIIVRVATLGRFPWIALSVCVTFGLYGVIRKIVSVESVPGLVVENLLFFPFSLAVLAWFAHSGTLTFGSGTGISLLLVSTGLFTALPMSLFAYGARHLKLTTLGIFHYLVPTFSFTLGVFVYNEPFGPLHFISFAIIWAALALYTFEKFRLLPGTPRAGK